MRRSAFASLSMDSSPDPSPASTISINRVVSATRSRNAGTTAPAFPSRIPRHIAGSPPATRVVSRNPPAAYRPAPGSPRSAASVATTAATCGKCEIRATVRSCSPAPISVTSHPINSQNTLTKATASSLAPPGVTMHAAPSYNPNRAAPSPPFSDPAIG